MILDVQNLSFSYHQPILSDVSFSVDIGEITALLGINGAGKSTLLKCINGLLKPQKGKIYVDGIDTKELTLKQLSKLVSYVAQTNTPTYCTVYDAILIGRKPHLDSNVSEDDHHVVQSLLYDLHLEKYALKYINQLSGGEYQKVVLARALAQEPKLLLLDEPTSNLDIKNQIEVLEILKKVCKEKAISVLVSIHDINLAARYAERFLMMKDGTIFQNGNSDVLAEENIDRVYGIASQVLKIDHKTIILPR